MLAGTPKYVPPEYVENGESDHRGDIYALGVMTYEMITGTLPFRSLTNTSLLKERLEPHGLDLGQRMPELPPDIVALVERCLAVQVIQRFPQAADVVDAVRAIQRTYGLSDTVECDRATTNTRVVWSDVLKQFEEVNDERALTTDMEMDV
jgi:serine/threonine-protein kinase